MTGGVLDYCVHDTNEHDSSLYESYTMYMDPIYESTNGT